MKKEEVQKLIQTLNTIFDKVRLVDCAVSEEYCLDENKELIKQDYHCHTIWGRESRCSNCISAKALSRKENMAKFEFIDQDVYYVIAHFIEVEGKPFVLEMINKNNDETLFSAHGQNEFVEKILSYNKKLYEDPLTGAYNRQYLEEQELALSCNNAVAMLDVDNLKKINDSKGHLIGDQVLKEITSMILSNIRTRDILVRYGGDEFLLIFKEMPEKIFAKKLCMLCEKCREIVLEECPDVSVSISLGGYFGQGDMERKIYEADMMLYEAKKFKSDVKVKFAFESV